MSHITLATQGLQAIEKTEWEKAISLLSEALQCSPNPVWLLARSRALINLKRYEEALDDASLAFHTAYERNKRDSMVEAQYRRAVAYFRLGQYANADCCCIYAMRLGKGLPAIEKEDPKTQYVDQNGFWTETLENAKQEARQDQFNNSDDKEHHTAGIPPQPHPHARDWRRASTMRMQCLSIMEKLPADDSARKVTVTVRPERKDLTNVRSHRDAKATDVQSSVPSSLAKTINPRNIPLRIQDFQSDTFITVTIFSKGVKRETLKVEFLDDSVRLNPLIYPNGEKKEFNVTTYSQINPSESSFTVTPNKVELRLAKKNPGKWPRLTKEEPLDDEKRAGSKELEAIKAAKERAMASAKTSAEGAGPASYVVETKDCVPQAADAKLSGLVYPTSSRAGPKNWDKIADDVDQEGEKGGVNDFFKTLYKDATDEQKRAMMKSFTESNGTTLSTDWEDVGKRTVGTVPPDGVEAKKW